MDGKGRWIDNVFVERLWKSVKYEHIYLHAYESVAEARQQLTSYFTFYNTCGWRIDSCAAIGVWNRPWQCCRQAS